MQNIWSIIKVMLKIDSMESFDEIMYNILYNTILSNKGLDIYKMIISIANNFIEKHPPFPERYSFIIKDIHIFKESPLEYLNYISYINYNGSETYFSRGAFLDVVVNGQICKSETIKLDINSYVDSFIENSIDLISHYHKEKYTIRIINSFGKILDIFYRQYTDIYVENKDLLDKIGVNLENLKKLQNTCTRGTLDCSRLLISDNCIENIFNLTSIYLQIYSIDDINSGIAEFYKQSKKFPNLHKRLHIDTESTQILERLSPRKNSLPF